MMHVIFRLTPGLGSIPRLKTPRCSRPARSPTHLVFRTENIESEDSDDLEEIRQA